MSNDRMRRGAMRDHSPAGAQIMAAAAAAGGCMIRLSCHRFVLATAGGYNLHSFYSPMHYSSYRMQGLLNALLLNLIDPLDAGSPSLGTPSPHLLAHD
jgi:hypothetical protein